MKRTVLFVIVLAAGLAASAWLGMDDSRSRSGAGAAQLNNSKKRAGLNEGEVLIWSPNMGSPPPGAAPSSSQLKAGQIYRAAPVPAAQPQPARSQSYYQAPAAREYFESQDYSNNRFYKTTRELVPLARPLGAPRAGEWRSQVREPEQDFGQFLNETRLASGSLVIQPIGDLPVDQKKAIGHLMDTLSAFYGMPAICAPPIPLSRVPAQCFRNAGDGYRQLNAEAVMRQVLRPALGGEVGAIIAVSALDLYPGESWPFESAFGWSSFDSGTSIISTAQILDTGDAYRGRNLLRLAKLGVHELAHTFGMKHCTKYQCLLNGSASIREYDTKPLALCPDCLAKLSLATGRTAELHLEDMLGLCRAKGFSNEAKHYQQALRILMK